MISTVIYSFNILHFYQQLKNNIVIFTPHTYSYLPGKAVISEFIEIKIQGDTNIDTDTVLEIHTKMKALCEHKF